MAKKKSKEKHREIPAIKDDNAYNAYVSGYNHALEDASNAISVWKYHKGGYADMAETIREMHKNERR